MGWDNTYIHVHEWGRGEAECLPRHGAREEEGIRRGRGTATMRRKNLSGNQHGGRNLDGLRAQRGYRRPKLPQREVRRKG